MLFKFEIDGRTRISTTIFTFPLCDDILDCRETQRKLPDLFLIGVERGWRL